MRAFHSWPRMYMYLCMGLYGSVTSFLTLGGPCKSIGISRSCSWAQLRGGVLGGPVA